MKWGLIAVLFRMVKKYKSWATYFSDEIMPYHMEKDGESYENATMILVLPSSVKRDRYVFVPKNSRNSSLDSTYESID